MKLNNLKLILKRSVFAAVISSLLLSTGSVKVYALEEVGDAIANEIIEDVENKAKNEAITEIVTEINEVDTKEVSDGNAEDEEVEVEPEEIVYENIDINSYAEFEEFAKNCKSDAWSLNKIVNLNTDIDLNAMDFEMIPYFNGIFKGGDHVIQGYGNAEDSYMTGLFRYIGPNGMVQDLNLSGNISMSDEMKYTGGICGMNQGVIKNCRYAGKIEGNNTVGAIAAINERSGIISNCVNDAHVLGYYFTGGIAGKNYGVISESTNSGNVNDTIQWVEKDDAKGESIIQSITAKIDEDTQKHQSGTDTGGVAGYSKGSIVRCTNKGNIGYEHVGYNVGGISGRQMGVITYCTNEGLINGRKDIGGIVGQMEPYLEAEDLQTLPEAADKLHQLIDQTITDMDGGVDNISSDVTDLTGYANGVVDDGHALAGELTTNVNANIRVANAALERFEYVMNNIPGVIDHLQGATDKMYYFNNSIARAVEAINVDEQVSDDDRYQIENSRDQIYQNLADVDENKQKMENITAAINQLMYETDENGDYIYDENGQRKLRILNEQEQAQLNAYLAELQHLVAESGDSVSGMLGGASTILESYKPYAQAETDDIMGETQNAISALQDADNELREATSGTRSIIDYLNSQEKLRLVGLGSDWDASLDSLHSNLKGIAGSIENINQDGKVTSHTLNSNLQAVNDQVNVIYHIISDQFNIIYNDDPELFKDVSDEEIEQAKTGRVDSAKNHGTVKGDINIGGIAGSMAIDDEDPEENAAGSLNIGKGSKYTLKNIICSCVNEATVESKKDGAGLIVGYMAQGIVTSCEGYGLAKSSEGNYTGGIAGQSLSIIRDCNALCLLDGNKYVGGITGYGATITGCNAMATWQKAPQERFGSIAGTVNTDKETRKVKLDNISNNLFVESEVGGIDDISFANVAEPISYKSLLEGNRTPDEFRHLKVVFEVEGKRLGEQELQYGESLDNLEFPTGDPRDGYYVKWPDVSGRIMDGSYVLTGEYVRTNKAIESNILYPHTNKHIAILGGSYGEDAYINAEIVDEPEYEIKSPVVEKNVVRYKISIDEGTFSQTKERKVRLYNPFKNSVVKEYKDGEWIEIPSRVVGSYLEVEMEENEGIFAIVERKSLWIRILYLVGLGLAILLIVGIIYETICRHDEKIMQKRRERKAKKEAMKQAELREKDAEKALRDKENEDE